MRDRGSHRPSGSIADLTRKPVKKVLRLCAGGCGAEVSGRKIYCGPCYATRYEANIAANRHKYRKPRKQT